MDYRQRSFAISVTEGGLYFGFRESPLGSQTFVPDSLAADGSIKKVHLANLYLIRTQVDSSSYSMQAQDSIIGVKYTTIGSCTITLLGAAFAGEGRVVRIIDEGGNAFRNNITISAAGIDSINGASAVRITNNYNSITLYSDGISNWYIT